MHSLWFNFFLLSYQYFSMNFAHSVRKMYIHNMNIICVRIELKLRWGVLGHIMHTANNDAEGRPHKNG